MRIKKLIHSGAYHTSAELHAKEGESELKYRRYSGAGSSATEKDKDSHPLHDDPWWSPIFLWPFRPRHWACFDWNTQGKAVTTVRTVIHDRRIEIPAPKGIPLDRSGWFTTQTPRRSVLAQLTHTAAHFNLRCATIHRVD